MIKPNIWGVAFSLLVPLYKDSVADRLPWKPFFCWQENLWVMDLKTTYLSFQQDSSRPKTRRNCTKLLMLGLSQRGRIIGEVRNRCFLKSSGLCTRLIVRKQVLDLGKLSARPNYIIALFVKVKELAQPFKHLFSFPVVAVGFELKTTHQWGNQANHCATTILGRITLLHLSL